MQTVQHVLLAALRTSTSPVKGHRPSISTPTAFKFLGVALSLELEKRNRGDVGSEIQVIPYSCLDLALNSSSEFQMTDSCSYDDCE